MSLKELARTLSEHGPNAKQVIMDSVDKLIEEGMQMGLSKGRTEGRTEGRKQMLLDLMRLKFGELSEADIARVEQADESALRQYSLRVLTADSVAAVLGG